MHSYRDIEARTFFVKSFSRQFAPALDLIFLETSSGLRDDFSLFPLLAAGRLLHAIIVIIIAVVGIHHVNRCTLRPVLKPNGIRCYI
jgi:hypothetical protein